MAGFYAALRYRNHISCSDFHTASQRSTKNEFTVWADFVEKVTDFGASV